MFKSSMLLVGIKYSSAGIQFFIKTLLSRILGGEAFGIFIASVNFVVFLSKLASFGSLISIQREAAKCKDENFSCLFYIPVLHAVLISLFSYCFLNLSYIVFLLPFLTYVATYSLYLTGKERFKELFYITNLPIIASFFFLLVADYILLKDDLVLYVYLSILYILPFFFSIFRFRVSISISKNAIFDFYNKHIKIFLVTSLAFFNYRSIVILAPFFLTGGMVSTIVIYHSFLEVIVVTIGAFASVLLNRLSLGDKRNLTTDILVTCSILCAIAIFFLFFGSALAKFLFEDSFNMDYAINIYMFVAIPICINKLLESFYFSISRTLPLMLSRFGYVSIFMVLFNFTEVSNPFDAYIIYISSYVLSSMILLYFYYCETDK
ncbi:hypothetical protein [Vibrio sp. THAF190c]|uniref:hypothetical protein n=1 Tax=Vibrio sp. THAF190c TaxID=2587865 RepID=UPI00126820AC|nr:hypothetical protein [Vibrio sp. THAF190c]QFT08588.1 hypothetical protein FIV04_01005 [Vibrio sp. THAF190c]